MLLAASDTLLPFVASLTARASLAARGLDYLYDDRSMAESSGFRFLVDLGGGAPAERYGVPGR
jgi:hypothetical protein